MTQEDTTELLERLKRLLAEDPTLAARLAAITGDGNVVGDHNVATVNKLSAGDYAIQIGQLHLTLSPDQLRSLLVSAYTPPPPPDAEMLPLNHVEELDQRVERSEGVFHYKLIVEATLDELDQCLTEYHSEHAEKYWVYGYAPTIDKTLSTRMQVWTYGENKELDGQSWNVDGLDITGAVEGDETFCHIFATRLQGWVNLGDVLEVEFHPSWRASAPFFVYSSYEEYLVLLVEEFQRRGMIKRLPEWVIELENKLG